MSIVEIPNPGEIARNPPVLPHPVRSVSLNEFKLLIAYSKLQVTTNKLNELDRDLRLARQLARETLGRIERVRENSRLAGDIDATIRAATDRFFPPVLRT
jgi:hypothetical protein